MTVLVVTGTRPDKIGVGEIFLSNMCSGIDVKRIFVSDVDKNKAISDANCADSFFYKNISWPILSDINIYFFYKTKAAEYAREILTEIRKDKYKEIVFVLSSPAIILILSEIIKINGRFKFRVLVWDVLEYICSNLRVSRFTSNMLGKAYKKIINSSLSLGVVSEGMYRNYFALNKFDIEPHKVFILRNAIDNQEKYSKNLPMLTDTQAKKFRIVFAGSLYCRAEWDALVTALQSVGFIVSNKKVELVFIGTPGRLTKFPEFGVINLGYLTQSQTLNVIKDCDAGYMPYWFSLKKELVVKTSFPGKVTSYLSMNLPIFYHGPGNSDVCGFVLKYNCGVTCTSLEQNRILYCIEKLMKDAKNIDLEEASSLFKQETVSTQFKKFVNLDD